MRHPSTDAIYDYWNEVRGGRRAPNRLEIQPSRISDYLLDTFILERAGQFDFRFRLAGTRFSGRLGLELRQRNFLTFWGGGDRGLLAHHLETISDLGQVGLFTGEAAVSDLQPNSSVSTLAFELILLPLVHSGSAMDRLLGHLVVLDPQGISAGASIERLKLLAAETIRPDRMSSTLAPAGGGFPAGTPHVRTARIVRHGRLQLRVYDGGLGAARGE